MRRKANPMMTPDEMIAVIQAFKEGKKLECIRNNDPNDVWESFEVPCFNFDKLDYRVAKEKKKRTFKVYARLTAQGSVFLTVDTQGCIERTYEIIGAKCLGEFTIEEGEGM